MAARAVILYLLWLVFAGTWKSHELIAGGVAAALALTGVEVAFGVEQPRFRPRWKWLPHFLRLPVSIVRDCLVLLNHIWRPYGAFRTVPFPAGGNDRESVARRALTIVYTTLPPNSLVIGIDRSHNRMLLHEIHKTGSGVPEWIHG